MNEVRRRREYSSYLRCGKFKICIMSFIFNLLNSLVLCRLCTQTNETHDVKVWPLGLMKIKKMMIRIIVLFNRGAGNSSALRNFEDHTKNCSVRESNLLILCPRYSRLPNHRNCQIFLTITNRITIFKYILFTIIIK